MRALDSPVAAQQVFTNRVDEISAFTAAVANLADELERCEVSPVVDRVRGRRNVLTFYGVGGIGKTTLSQELERRYVAEAQEKDREEAVAIRIDLGEPGASDVEGRLLRLRAGLGRLGERWLATDLALSCWWARAHPGEPLQEFLDSSPLVRRAARSVKLGQQIASNVQALVPADLFGVPGVAHRAGLALYRVVRDRVRERRLLADCDLFAELIEADADYDTLSYFPYLLAWDLAHLPRRARRPSVCVFLDTFEAITGLADREAERLLQRCIYLMPNVLFVITGRNRIDWADTSTGGELDFAGKDRWPNLHYANSVEEPRQHLVGYLSDSDADAYLCAALTLDGQPAIPVEIRQRIVSGAQGLPLYLDLSVSHFVDMLARDDQPEVDDFGGSFTAVATRTLRDLPEAERELVRTASLVDRFDAALLYAAQPSLSEGRIVRFLQRPFLTRDDAYGLPYTLHLTLRMAIGDADETMHDGWSDTDRKQAGQRLLGGLGDHVTEDADRASVAQTLEAGLKLANTHNIFDPWLVTVTQRLVEAGQWATLGSGLPAEPPEQPELRAVNAAIKGILLRRQGDPIGAVAVLEEAAAADEPSGKQNDLIRLHLAHALRNTGDYTRAAGIYRELLDSDFAHSARYWLCDYDYLNGRFLTALTDLDSWRGSDAADEGERLRLVGHIARVNARFDDAAQTYSEAITLAETEGLAAAEAKALTNLAQTRCWAGVLPTMAEVTTRARELLDLVPNPVELVKLRSAEAVAAVLADDFPAASIAIDETRQLADEIGYRGGHNLADVASILLAARAGEHDSAIHTLRSLADRTAASGGNFYWAPIAATWINEPGDYDDRWRGIEWLDGPQTLQRWVRLPIA